MRNRSLRDENNSIGSSYTVLVGIRTLTSSSLYRYKTVCKIIITNNSSSRRRPFDARVGKKISFHIQANNSYGKKNLPKNILYRSEILLFQSRTFQFYDMGRKSGATTTIKKSHSKKRQKPYGDANGGYVDDPEEAEDYAHRRI